ncbi:MAG: dockerin type I repeat-containing protein, partial [Clostridia bacterium]|nr:dockerin type I repeat-containing protein [Clostridia bacterium]
SSEKGTVYAGGIVGYVDSSSKITKCYNSSYILSSSNEILGGIVGCINSSSQISISACYNSGLINEGYSAGGIVGYAYLLAPSQISISDCYNSGSINAGYNAGGIVGYLYSPSSIYPKTNITNCYNVANIYASRYAGGIVGQRNYVTFSCSNCYYKIGCATFGSAIAQGVYTEDDSSTKCKAYTAGNLKKQENYVGFDFDKVWTIDPNSDYPYPTLISLPFGIDCAHIYEDTVVAPTCTEKGYTLHTCAKCSDKYEDNFVSATGHAYKDSVTAPTCTEQGYTTHTCSACGDSYTDSYVTANGHKTNDDADCTTSKVCTVCGTTVESAKGHNYVDKVTAPTCTEQGYTTHTCSACGDSYTDSYIRSNGHTAGEKANCTNNQICTTCGTTLVESLGHNYKDVVTAPTCTEQGYTTHTCSTCGDTYKDSYVTENGHKTNDAVDCNTAKVCSVCGVTVESAKGHNYVDKVTAPTCTEQGYTTHTCSACGDSYTDSYVRSNGHTAGEKADCTHDQICTTCGETLASASGHNYTEKVTAPTCTEQGYTTHTCGNCGDSYKDSYVRSNGHSAGEKADCTHDQICTSCGETLVEALGHTEGEWKIVVEATVGEKGLMEQHCAECDTVLDSKEIPALEGDIETYSLGDVNADKKVDSVDYLLVKRACFKTYALSEEETIRADVNVDKKVDSTDYLLVKRIAFGTYTVK